MYYPNLKTTDSELRALRHLATDVRRRITPVFELTRSRKTKALPSGSLSKRVEQLKEIYGQNPCIIDLCTEQDLMNEETLDLFDEDNGYGNWLTFLDSNFAPPAIPCVLYVEDGTKQHFNRQVEAIVERYGKVCIRTSVLDDLAALLYSWALEVVPESKIVLCPILYYIDPTEYQKVKDACTYYVQTVVGNRFPDTLIFAGSSFPRNVLDLPNCSDSEGSFPLLELNLERELMASNPNLPLQRADFGSVHPRRYQTKGGTWIPRIDYVEGMESKYRRVRREYGGYKTAASLISSASIASLPKCWGTDQISAAKTGNVLGGSPSFWISVRINCWITSRSF